MSRMSDIEKELAWLRMEATRHREEEAQFNSDTPYVAGTNSIARIVPPIPPLSLRQTVSSSSMAGYLITGDAWFFVLQSFIKQGYTVLDIGCGCGKLARLLLTNPFVTKYIGFDNYKKNIDWCLHHLAPYGKGTFEFHHIDILSEAYNPSGAVKGTEVVFPAEDASVDFVFAASLFTHLLEQDAKHYLHETKRVLKKDGIFLPSIHTNPTAGANYSGNEIRIDVIPKYFVELAQEVGLNLVEELGSLQGQYALLFSA